MTDFNRAAGIGGSDVPAILGVSPYRDRTDVWMEKTHHPAWRPKPETPEMRFGTLLEPIMRQAYSEDTGWRVHAPGDRTYWAEDRIRFAHLDGLVEGEGVWEGKAPFQTWRNWSDGPPVYVLAQVQHYLDITKEPWCDVSALAAGLDPIFQTFRVHADADTQANIGEAVLRFWRRHVETGEPPEPLPVKYEFPTHKSDLMLVADDEAEALVAAIREADRDLSSDSAHIDELKDILKRRIGLAAGMVGNGWRIRYKKNRDSEKTDWKLVAASLRRIVEMIETDSGVEKARSLLTDTPLDSIIRLYTTTTTGARPFNLEDTTK